MLTQCAENHGTDACGQYILGPDLDNARARGMSEREKVAEIQIVGEDDETVCARPGQDLLVFSLWVSYRGPVESVDFVLLEEVAPCGGKAHVHENLHPRATGTSNSSTRQVAYARDARMSSFSR